MTIAIGDNNDNVAIGFRWRFLKAYRHWKVHWIGDNGIPCRSTDDNRTMAIWFAIGGLYNCDVLGRDCRQWRIFKTSGYFCTIVFLIILETNMSPLLTFNVQTWQSWITIHLWKKKRSRSISKPRISSWPDPKSRVNTSCLSVFLGEYNFDWLLSS